MWQQVENPKCLSLRCQQRFIRGHCKKPMLTFQWGEWRHNSRHNRDNIGQDIFVKNPKECCFLVLGISNRTYVLHLVRVKLCLLISGWTASVTVFLFKAAIWTRMDMWYGCLILSVQFKCIVREGCTLRAHINTMSDPALYDPFVVDWDDCGQRKGL